MKVSACSVPSPPLLTLFCSSFLPVSCTVQKHFKTYQESPFVLFRLRFFITSGTKPDRNHWKKKLPTGTRWDPGKWLLFAVNFFVLTVSAFVSLSFSLFNGIRSNLKFCLSLWRPSSAFVNQQMTSVSEGLNGRLLISSRSFFTSQ